jgi:hypothetical protein
MGNSESAESREIREERDKRLAELDKSRKTQTDQKVKKTSEQLYNDAYLQKTYEDAKKACQGDTFCLFLVDNDRAKKIVRAQFCVDYYNSFVEKGKVDIKFDVADKYPDEVLKALDEVKKKQVENMLKWSKDKAADVIARAEKASKPDATSENRWQAAKAFGKLLLAVAPNGLLIWFIAFIGGKAFELNNSSCIVQPKGEVQTAQKCSFVDEDALTKAKTACTCSLQMPDTVDPCQLPDPPTPYTCPALDPCGIKLQPGQMCGDTGGGWYYEFSECDWTCGFSHFIDAIAQGSNKGVNFLEWMFTHIGAIVTIVLLIIVVPIFLSVFRTLHWKQG